MHLSHLAVAAFAALTAAAPSAVRHVLHEKRTSIPHSWVKRHQVPRDQGHVFPMRIGLVQSKVDRAEELLMEIAHHESPKYGQHLTEAEVIDLFAPPQAAVDAVRAWLVEAGIAADRISQSFNRQWIQFDAYVEEVEELLKTKYFAYEQVESGKMNIACDEYHVPEHITAHVDYIMPGLRLLGDTDSMKNDLRAKRAMAKEARQLPGPIPGHLLPANITNATKAQLLAECDTVISPPCIAAMYNITQGTLAHAGNQLGIFESGDYLGQEDLAEFLTAFAPNVPPTTQPTLNSVDGGMDLEVATGESDLDFQISYPIIYPQNSILFQTDDVIYTSNYSYGEGIFNTFLDAIDGSYCTSTAFGITGNSAIDPKYPDPNPAGYQGKLMCGTYKPTNVISVSYGLVEASFPDNYQRRQCLEFMKLGMQGTTVVFASGDSGVAARYQASTAKDDCLGSKGTVFAPDYPASCPYLTAVGATYLPKGGNVNKDQEVAVTSFPSGGGFSNVYKRPNYQKKAVLSYLQNHPPGYKSYALTTSTSNPTDAQTNGGIYNSAGRGYPDLAAVGDNILIILDGAPMTIGGTSAAAPLFAALVTRINEERLQAGKKTVGFVNPVLYANPGAFHDITVGSNPGCRTKGFAAATGWDPVTGLGTPNYPALLKVFLSLP